MSATKPPKPIPKKRETTLGIRLPNALRKRVRAAAAADRRTESSFARLAIERAVDEVMDGSGGILGHDRKCPRCGSPLMNNTAVEWCSNTECKYETGLEEDS